MKHVDQLGTILEQPQQMTKSVVKLQLHDGSRRHGTSKLALQLGAESFVDGPS